jgi:5-methyltetrahydropteroyltriglutamate--homocysteine methyltransferase
MASHERGETSDAELAAAQDEAVRDTIRRFEEAGSPVVTDGEQSKPSFLTYPITGLANVARGGITIPFADGHQRQLPVLTGGPFRYRVHADVYLKAALRYANVAVKQAVIAPSALSLLYPPTALDGYGREEFLDDLITEAEADIRSSLEAGANVVQLDFTEARLSLKLDPSGGVLDALIALNNQVLERFSASQRSRIGVHSCPGGDQDSTHSLDVDYAELLPKLFQLKAGNFYIQLASEADPGKTLAIVARYLPADARIFIGVTDPIDPEVETPEQVRDRVLAAARHLPPDRIGTCDDCGFSPFADDTSTARDTAFAKIRARVEGTSLAAQQLGL